MSAVSDLMTKFQSLGDNCEFGYVQSHYGARCIDLLQWAGIEVRGLILGLEADFSGVFSLPNLKYYYKKMVTDSVYGATFHVSFDVERDNNGNLLIAGDDSAALFKKEAGRINFLVRKFLDDLDGGERIYVFKRDPALTPAEAIALHAALSRRKPQRLLCVSTEQSDLRGEEVRLVHPGLKIGALSRFAPASRSHRADYDGWEVLCRKAIQSEW